jgi:lysozyme family protein
MHSVQNIAAEIVRREGGYVNDPDDPGGATKFGVTIHTMRALGIDLTGDGRVTDADVKALTLEQAVEIYIKHYFAAPHICDLPEPLHATVFDMQVNSGSNAVRLLQTLTGHFGQPLAPDGQIGPKTAAAVEKAFGRAPEHLVDAYGIARRNYYYSLADRRPASRKYARRKDGGKGGWIVRAEEFIAPRFHFTQEQHEERTAAWD